MDDGPEPIGVEESCEFAYAEARRILDEAKEQALDGYRAEMAKRRKIVIVAFVMWLAMVMVLYAIASPYLLVAAELGFALAIMFSVCYLMPLFMNRGNINETLDRYENRIDELELSFVPFPICSSLEQLADILTVREVAS